MKLKMIELFAGIGGFQLAGEWVGIKTIESVEINPFCQKVLSKNFPNTPIYNDVTSYNPKFGKAQIVCGGSPCQDLSIAGKQKGIIEGKRSSLWFEQLRIYQESGATFLVWENVSGALRNGFGEVLRSLSSIGCNAEWETISASALGAPHRRDRIFLIAYPASLQFSREPSPWADQVRCQAAIASTYPLSLRQSQPQGSQQEKRRRASNCLTETITDPNGIRREVGVSRGKKNSVREAVELRNNNQNITTSSPWSSSKSPVCGVPHGFPHRLDRISALGNAIVPQCAVVPLLRVKYLASLLQ